MPREFHFHHEYAISGEILNAIFTLRSISEEESYLLLVILTLEKPGKHIRGCRHKDAQLARATQSTEAKIPEYLQKLEKQGLIVVVEDDDGERVIYSIQRHRELELLKQSARTGRPSAQDQLDGIEHDLEDIELYNDLLKNL